MSNQRRKASQQANQRTIASAPQGGACAMSSTPSTPTHGLQEVLLVCGKCIKTCRLCNTSNRSASTTAWHHNRMSAQSTPPPTTTHTRTRECAASSSAELGVWACLACTLPMRRLKQDCHCWPSGRNWLASGLEGMRACLCQPSGRRRLAPFQGLQALPMLAFGP